MAELEDTLARPDQIKAAIALLRAWREEGDIEEQRETLAVLQAAFPADFPDETPAGL
ncbi:MAG: hypothetical protein MI924_31145 [Chloroflexales bacterium]|nr:hypothetical protein [Chloroflexales bacterium]